LTPNSARAGGAKRYFSERSWQLLDRMDAMAKEKDASPAQLALAWLLADPLITSPIIGANSPEQLAENLGALEIRLSAGERDELAAASSWEEERG
jgi:aryl-alcohol dehydrogenase-like predicted oxidoreductase